MGKALKSELEADRAVTHTSTRGRLKPSHQIAFAVSLAIAAKANAVTLIPTVVVPGPCASYADMQSAASSYAKNVVLTYSGTPQGFPSSQVLGENYTQL